MWKPFGNRPKRHEFEGLWTSIETLRELVHQQGKVVDILRMIRIDEDKIAGVPRLVNREEYDKALDDVYKQLKHLRENKADLGHKHSL